MIVLTLLIAQTMSSTAADSIEPLELPKNEVVEISLDAIRCCGEALEQRDGARAQTRALELRLDATLAELADTQAFASSVQSSLASQTARANREKARADRAEDDASDLRFNRWVWGGAGIAIGAVAVALAVGLGGGG